MSVSIGIRANPSEISYCVVVASDEDILIKIIDEVVVPKAMEIPEQLKFIRNTFCDILEENQVKKACIRVTESTAKNISIQRIYIEGVLQELIASSPIDTYYIGQIANMTKYLRLTNRADFKKHVDGTLIFNELEDWPNWSIEEKESILAAFSALNL